MLVHPLHRRDVINGVGVTHNVESRTTEKYGTWLSRTSLAIYGEIIFVFRHKMMSLANIIQAYMVPHLNTLFTLSQTLLYGMSCINELSLNAHNNVIRVSLFDTMRIRQITIS